MSLDSLSIVGKENSASTSGRDFYSTLFALPAAWGGWGCPWTRWAWWGRRTRRVRLAETFTVYYLPYLLLWVVEDVLGFAEHGGEGELGEYVRYIICPTCCLGWLRMSLDSLSMVGKENSASTSGRDFYSTLFALPAAWGGWGCPWIRWAWWGRRTRRVRLAETFTVHYLPYLLLGVVEDVLGFAEHGGEGELGEYVWQRLLQYIICPTCCLGWLRMSLDSLSMVGKENSASTSGRDLLNCWAHSFTRASLLYVPHMEKFNTIQL